MAQSVLLYYVSVCTYDVIQLIFWNVDAYLGQLKEELNSVEVQNAKMSSEIEDLMETYVEGGDCLFFIGNVKCMCADVMRAYLQILIDWRASLKG